MLTYEFHLFMTYQDMQMHLMSAFYVNLSVQPCCKCNFVIISLELSPFLKNVLIL